MVQLLRIKRKTGNTIREILLNYIKQAILLLAVVIIASYGFYSLAIFNSARENQRLFLINDFITNLLEVDELIYEYVVKKDAFSYIELMNELKTLVDSANDVGSFKVSTSFQRDMEDIIGILSHYSQQIDRIHLYISDGLNPALINEIYRDTGVMSNMINKAIQTVYQQIFESSETNSIVVRNRLLYYTLILVITILLIIHCIIQQTRNMEQRITIPIQDLTKEVREINLNNIEKAEMLADIPNANAEINSLVFVYNAMLEKIKKQLYAQKEHLNTKIKLQEQEMLNLQISNKLKKSQLLNLQMQINPHFLFNTLNMISHSAYLENSKNTVSLLEATADLLRYVLDYSDKLVPLAKEIENLGKYVFLLEQRFGDRIRFIFDLDESFHQILVPNLILQPLLENAIVHGVGMYTDGGEIKIQTAYDAKTQVCRISIIDNGEGMDSFQLMQVDSVMRSSEENTGRIGLANVFLRLNIFFHNRADIRLSSIQKKRTEIAILFPYQ